MAWRPALLGTAAVLVVVAMASRLGSPGAVGALLARAPEALALVWAMPLAIAALDTECWRRVLLRLGVPVGFPGLLRIRLSAEAMVLGLPTGGVLAEAATPHLLRRGHGVPLGAGWASVAGRKWMQVLAQSLFLAAAAVLARRLDAGSPGGAALRLLPALAAVALFSVAWAFGRWIHRTSASGAAAPATPRLRWAPARWRRGIAAALAPLQGSGPLLARLLDGKRRPPLWTAGLAALGAWLMEALDALLILRLLGGGLGFAQVMPLEASVSLARSLALFTPAGLGVQELGYFAGLKAAGAVRAVELAAALALVKRTREAFWIAVGSVLLARQARSLPAAA